MTLRPGLLWLCAIFALLATLATAEPSNDAAPKRRYSYKHAFKRPYYYNQTVPFWDTYGDTLLARDFIRLAPSVPNHSGAIWAQSPSSFNEWEVLLTFKISGNYLVGGRGIAFWYTKDRGEHGPVYGSRDSWDGLAIFFEAGDASQNRAHPLITAYLNDGSYQLNNSHNPEAHSFAGCYRMFRNTRDPVHAKVTHFNNAIKLEIDTSNRGTRYEKCFEAHKIILPQNYYFGVSAIAEGDTPDDLDVLSLETYEFNPPEKKDASIYRPRQKTSSTSEDYVIPDDVRKRIDKISSTVHKSDEVAKQDSLGTDFVRGMQVQILENLNRLEKRIEFLASDKPLDPAQQFTPPPPSDHSIDTVFRKLEQVLVAFSALESKMAQNAGDQARTLSHITSKLNLLESQMAAQSQHVNRLHDTARQHHSEIFSAHQSTWSYILYFTFGAIALWAGFVLYQTRKEKLDKKFI